MKEFNQKVIEYRKNKNLTDEECAEKLDLSKDIMQKILQDDDSFEIDNKEKDRILGIINSNNISKGRKAVKILDLMFRFASMIMALVTLLLCINENVDTRVLIVLLSIGLVCSSMILLPRIEK